MIMCTCCTWCCRFSVPHVIRCFMGSSLRAMVWGSALNLALSVTGSTKGFWAAKVTSVGKLNCWFVCLAGS